VHGHGAAQRPPAGQVRRPRRCTALTWLYIQG
jgi:hypothetical protein